MKLLKIFGLWLIVISPAYAEIEVIEWGSGIESNVADKSDAQVDIYVTSWCPYCKRAIAYLNAKGVKYNEYDIENDSNAAARKKALAPNYNGIPLAVIYGKTIMGFSEAKYAAALENTDYKSKR